MTNEEKIKEWLGQSAEWPGSNIPKEIVWRWLDEKDRDVERKIKGLIDWWKECSEKRLKHAAMEEDQEKKRLEEYSAITMMKLIDDLQETFYPKTNIRNFLGLPEEKI
jgi:hypothetical protein